MRPMAGVKNGLIAALDLGTTKVCCLIARLESGRPGEPARVRIVGKGHQVARGMRAGTVVEMGRAEQSVRSAVEVAEKMAGETIRRVLVTLSGGHPSSQVLNAQISVGGHQITSADTRRVLQNAYGRVHLGGREVIHGIPIGYSVDECDRIRDPRGLSGAHLGVSMHMVTAAAGAVRNVALSIDRCDLELAGMVLSPFASALACLVEDEMELGACCIDMGGGTTSLAVFSGGTMNFADVIPLGGIHVTNDIARGLSTPLSHAERLKTLLGNALPSPSDEREMIDVPQIGEEDRVSANQIPRAVLTGIIRPRIEETLEFVRDRLKASGFDKVVGRRVVLTGGAAQLTGVRELASRILDTQARVGRPLNLNGLSDRAASPTLSAAAGLLAYAARGPIEAVETDAWRESGGGDSKLNKIGRWLRACL